MIMNPEAWSFGTPNFGWSFGADDVPFQRLNGGDGLRFHHLPPGKLT